MRETSLESPVTSTSIKIFFGLGGQKVFSLLAAFVINIVLARFLDQKIMACTFCVSLHPPCRIAYQCGLPQLLTREVIAPTANLCRIKGHRRHSDLISGYPFASCLYALAIVKRRLISYSSFFSHSFACPILSKRRTTASSKGSMACMQNLRSKSFSR